MTTTTHTSTCSRCGSLITHGGSNALTQTSFWFSADDEFMCPDGESRHTVVDSDAALALVMEFGSMLAAKDEWDMDDNFDTTEALYSLYCEITGHGS